MHYLFPRLKIQCQECIKSSFQVLVSLNERREKLFSLDKTVTTTIAMAAMIAIDEPIVAIQEILSTIDPKT